MFVTVVPGQACFRWCVRCTSWSVLEVGVYVLDDDGPELVGTFTGCTGCDPDLFDRRPADPNDER